VIRTGVPGGRPEPPEAIITGNDQRRGFCTDDFPEDLEGGTEPGPGRPKSICLWSYSEFTLYFSRVFWMYVAVSGQQGHPALMLRVGNFSKALEYKVVNAVPWLPLNFNLNFITLLELLDRLETFGTTHDAAVPEGHFEARGSF